MEDWGRVERGGGGRGHLETFKEARAKSADDGGAVCFDGLERGGGAVLGEDGCGR